MTPTVAAATGALAFGALALHQHAQPLSLLRLCLLGATLAAAAASDLKSRRIPNRLVLPSSLACLALLLASSPLSSAMIEPLALVAGLLLLSLLRPAALGMGDSKLALLLVCGLGSSAGQALLAGIAAAGIAAVGLLVREGRCGLGRSLPLAPFFALGTLLIVVR